MSMQDEVSGIRAYTLRLYLSLRIHTIAVLHCMICGFMWQLQYENVYVVDERGES